MSILLEAVSAMFGACSMGGYIAFKNLLIERKAKRKQPIDPLELDSVKWLWQNNDIHGKGGFQCPVCMCRFKNPNQPKLCECPEFPRDHFHFECADCGYNPIMRTANDPIDVKKG
jgi:hypothetical protein